MVCQILVPVLLLLNAMTAVGQASYSGTVGTAPIEMVIEAPAVGPARSTYAYTKFNTPILLSGSLRSGTLVLTEKNSQGKATATLTLPAFSDTARAARGVWKNLVTGQILPLALTQRFAVEAGEGSAWTGWELLQSAALKNSYFKAVLTKQSGTFTAHISAIKLYEKKTNRLLQTFPLDCQLLGVDNVSVGDFNFDGFTDFAVFEQSYAGPNTSSRYFLYNPTTKRYAESSYSGVSLEFDAGRKRIYERNSCCAGTSVTTGEYKVVHNRMVLVAQHCYKWNEKKQELMERKWSACQ